MTGTRYYGEDAKTGLAGWGDDTLNFKPGSITDASMDNEGLFTGDTFYDGTGGVSAGPGMTEGIGMNTLGNALGSGWDMLKGGLNTVSGLAGLYMDWDKLQSTKASARDTHNASATQYNNYLNRAKSASASMGLPSSAGGHSRSNVKKSTV